MSTVHALEGNVFEMTVAGENLKRAWQCEGEQRRDWVR